MTILQLCVYFIPNRTDNKKNNQHLHCTTSEVQFLCSHKRNSSDKKQKECEWCFTKHRSRQPALLHQVRNESNSTNRTDNKKNNQHLHCTTSEVKYLCSHKRNSSDKKQKECEWCFTKHRSRQPALLHQVRNESNST